MKKKLILIGSWTLFYVVFATMFFYALFGFKIWGARSWTWLAHAHLHGIFGLTFGASLLAAIPTYLSVTFYIFKNGKLPFKLPKFPKKDKPAKETPKPEPAGALQPPKFPENLPDELKEPYIRVQSGVLAKNAVDFIMPKQDIFSVQAIPITANVAQESESFMPMPESFNGALTSESTPVFKEISFDEETSDVVINEQDGKTVATFVFDSPEFWVADAEGDWFATGGQLPSPIKQLLNAQADERILILKFANIMNLDALIPQWESKGITVKLDLEENQ